MMSKSYKLAIIKDRPRNYKKSTKYWRIVRRILNQDVNKEVIRQPKEVLNDYVYSDYRFDYEHGTLTKHKDYQNKLRRK